MKRDTPSDINSEAGDDVDMDRARMEASKRKRNAMATLGFEKDEATEADFDTRCLACWGCDKEGVHELFCDECIMALETPDASVEKAIGSSDVGTLLGRQASFISKLMDTKTILQQPNGKEKAFAEFKRLAGKSLGDPVELETVPENANVVHGKLLMSVKNWEAPTDQQALKARLVATGNVIFDKHGHVKTNLLAQDLWAAVCSMTGARYIEARAVAHQRDQESVDLIQAYSQVLLGGATPYFFVVPAEILALLEPNERARFKIFKRPACPIVNGVYGIGRAGYDFVRGLAAWLITTKWIQVPEEPALLVYWQVDDEPTTVRRALSTRDYARGEIAAGGNAFEKAAQNKPRGAVAGELSAEDRCLGGTSGCAQETGRDLRAFRGNGYLR